MDVRGLQLARFSVDVLICMRDNESQERNRT